MKGVTLFFLFFFTCVFLGKGQVPTRLDSAKGKKYIEKALANFRSNPDTAIFYLKESLPVLEFTKQWDLYVKSCNGLYASHYMKRDFPNAEVYGNKAYEATLFHFGKKHESYITALSNLGMFYAEKGDLAQSVSFFQKAIEDAKNIEGFPANKVCRIYNNLGFSFRRLGDNEEAIRYFDMSIQSIQEDLAMKSKFIFNKGRALNEQGNYAEALVQYKLALSTLVGLDEKRVFPQYVACFHKMSNIYLLSGYPDSAKTFVDRAIKIQEKYYWYRKETSMDLLGEIYVLDHEYRKALPYFEEALQITKNKYGTLGRHSRIGEAYLKLAQSHWEIGNERLAMINFQHALEEVTGNSYMPKGQENPRVHDILHPSEGLGILFSKARFLKSRYHKSEDVQDLIASFETYLVAIEMMSRLRKNHISPASKLWVRSNYQPVYAEAIASAIKLDALFPSQNYKEQAFSIVEKGKAMVLYGDLQAASAPIAAGLPDSIIQQEIDLKIEIGYLREKAEMLVEEEEQMLAWKKELFEKEEKYRFFIKKIETEFPRYFQLKYQEGLVSLKKISKKCKNENAFFLEFFETDSLLYIFGISAEGFQIQEINKKDGLNDGLEMLLRELHSPSQDITGIHQFVESASKLHTLLIAPFDIKPEIEKLIIIPDGKIGFLPFECLLTEKSQSEIDPRYYMESYRELPYLIRDFRIQYDYSATLLSQKPKKKKEAGNLLATFAPDYLDNLELVYNKPQAKQVAKLLGGDFFESQKANEAVFKNKVKDYRLLHLAMHGEPNVAHPLFARLLFSQQGSKEVQDGFLHAYEIYDLPMNAELTVLSACETGIGKLTKGEGVMSLARAFRHAGCPSTIYSLWKVDGRAAQSLMVEMYASLKKGKEKSSSLRNAQLTFLDQTTPDQLHPHFWATFVLAGNDNPVINPWVFWVRLLFVLGFVMLVVFLFFFKKE